MPSQRDVESPASVAADRHGRERDFLDEAEISRLLEAARKGRYGLGDHLLMILMYRHGLRVSEAIAVRLNDLSLEQSRLWGPTAEERPVR